MEQVEKEKENMQESRHENGATKMGADRTESGAAMQELADDSQSLRLGAPDPPQRATRPKIAEVPSSVSSGPGYHEPYRPAFAAPGGVVAAPEHPRIATLEVIHEQNEESKGGSQCPGIDALESQSALPSPRSRMTSFQNSEIPQKQGSFS